MRPLVAWIWMAVAAASPTAQGYEFNGLEVGGPATYDATEVQAALEGINKGLWSSGFRTATCETTPSGHQACKGVTTVSGEPTESQALVSPGGVVEQLSLFFRPSAFRAIEKWALSQYGEPSDTVREPFVTQSGRPLKNVDHVWLDGEGRFIRLTRYPGRGSESRLHFGLVDAPRPPP